MAAALTPLLASAAGVLLVAGAAKLRSPGGASAALQTLGLPAARFVVRGVAACEIALGVACLLDPSTVIACLVAAIYAMFALVALLLARRSSSCGCFGDPEMPASPMQSVLSLMLSVVALTAAIAGAHGSAWMLDRPIAGGVALIAAIAGSAYGLVLAYTRLPAAWVAWAPSGSGSPR